MMNSLLTADMLEKNRRSNFYYSFLILPKPKREAINVIYAWCRCTDDIVDEEEVPALKQDRLRQWTNEFERALDGNSRFPLLNTLTVIIRKFKIPTAHFRDLIRGMEMDLNKTRYQTFDELREYCYCAAATVGLMCTEIFGYRHDGAKEYAVKLGIALQLTNILRDVSVDLEKGRIYLPLDDMNKFGYSESDLRLRVYDDRFVALMKFESERTRMFFNEAVLHLSDDDKPLFIAARIMEAIYLRILELIEKNDYDVFSQRIRISFFRKLLIVASVWWNNHPFRRHDS